MGGCSFTAVITQRDRPTCVVKRLFPGHLSFVLSVLRAAQDDGNLLSAPSGAVACDRC